MAAAFRPVNNRLSAGEHTEEATVASPMTPRPTTAPAEPTKPLDEAKTPTRTSFGASASAMASQRPLPTSPFPESVQVPEPAAGAPPRDHSQHSRRSKESSEDVDMDDTDGEAHAADDGAGSDEESVDADGTKNKKKKSQRFYCTDYPPCNLSFTRSEHLARHIRKHTGERPFQCHCSRRFSRLDNLRQHAQTVHVNEDIPIDSLAATGTRFQRQIRTDRVRQPGRARASTAGSVGPGGRGHAKSLSTSSIASVSSIASTYSINEARRRPPALIMAESRPRLESYRAPDGQYYRPPSPSDFSTPTSATFSTGQNSPHWGPVMSPNSSHSRSHSMYAGVRTPGRRLSVPSGGNNPFQSPHGPGVRGPIFGPSGLLNSSNSGTLSPSQSSLLSSPTASTSAWSRRDSFSSVADEAWRRLPPDTVTVPNPPPPAGQPPQQLRLPGIESFDEITPLPPPRRIPSPMVVDSNAPNPPTLPRPGDLAADERQVPASQWDTHLHRGLTRLDINTPPRDSAGAWASEANQALLARAEQARVRFEPEVKEVPVAPAPMVPAHAPAPPPMLVPRHQHTVSAPVFNTPRETKRHGWYNGPVTPHPAGEAAVQESRPMSTGSQQPGPGMERMERIPERPPNHQGTTSPESLKRLEALVAVATSEGSATTAY
ncbi:330bb991-99b9-4474-b05c-9eafe6b36f2f [Thermothielavioides terrestris]|uniref:330bb991-99b9-4474-b05c-9eafe6b36f2f n=1 Tax=Thermothielavioides terrestris TaxID=2587410 RepID=A0A446BT51_9PEZI|nr:330bb991-99b9-4474-b05c-9eafe6b36f2f [Thermothielavioides terrestris]